MTALTSPAAGGSDGPARKSFVAEQLGRHHFLLRRLHSLTGIVPVGLFTIGHLFTNAQMIWGQDAEGNSSFQHEVDFIHNLPFLLFIEIGIWSAIAFHAGLGLFYTFSGKGNVKSYSYGDNVRYMLQRATGLIALVFIFFHIATLRWRWDILGIWDTPFYARGYQVPGMTETAGGVLDKAPLSVPLTAYALQYSAWVALFYLIGVVAVVFHWANGLWTAAISWGLTISVGSMRKWGYACVGLFIALMVFFASAFVGSLKFDFDTMTAEQKAATLLTVGPQDGQWAFQDQEGLKNDLASLGMEWVLVMDEPEDANDERPVIEPSDTNAAEVDAKPDVAEH
ncbi:MAG: hypothetical protein AAF916_01630 [Planctomycetota bacterium]